MTEHAAVNSYHQDTNNEVINNNGTNIELVNQRIYEKSDDLYTMTTEQRPL